MQQLYGAMNVYAKQLWDGMGFEILSNMLWPFVTQHPNVGPVNHKVGREIKAGRVKIDTKRAICREIQEAIVNLYP